MAGEIVKTEAICLDIRPWSKTSHIVYWLTPTGRVATVVKGAVRPKSAFLGQYDLNYTCEILYYLRAHGDLHALRECRPIALREGLRASYRSLAVAGYFRELLSQIVPQGAEAQTWFGFLSAALDGLDGTCELAKLLCFEVGVLKMIGLNPEIEAEDGVFFLRGERQIPVSGEIVDCLRRLPGVSEERVLLDSARVIGVYYEFHMDVAAQTRRSVLRILQTK